MKIPRQFYKFLPLLPLLLAAISFAPIFRLPFIGTDPVDIGQVAHLSWRDLLVKPHSASYYRPLTMLLLKLMMGGRAVFSPLPYHLSLYLPHLACTALVFWLVRLLFPARRLALMVSALFAVYPLNVQTLAVGHTPYPWQTTLLLLGACALLMWWESRKAGWYWLAWCACLAGQFLHENGILLPALLGWSLLWRVFMQKGTAGLLDGKLWRAVLLLALPSVGYLFLWKSLVPTQGSGVLAPEWGIAPDRLAYLSQGVSYPLAGWLANLPFLAGFPRLQPNFMLAWLAFGGAAGLFAILLRPYWKLALFSAGWFFGALALAFFTRSYAYLELAPRLFYMPAFGACLLWALLAQRLPRKLSWWMFACLLASSIWLHTRSLQLYLQAGDTLRSLLALQAQHSPDSSWLVVNFPDRVEARARLLPVGYWGVIVAPVSVELGAYAQMQFASQQQLESLSEFVLSAQALEASPYWVFTRGENAYASQRLVDAIHASQQVLVTDYSANGKIRPRWVGGVLPEPDGEFLGQIGEHLRMNRAELQPVPGCSCLQLQLVWQVLKPPQAQHSLFVHLLAPDGSLLAQADGPALGGIYLPFAWQAQETLLDVRQFPLVGEIPSGARLRAQIGLFDSNTGIRLPVLDAHGQVGDSLPVAEITLP